MVDVINILAGNLDFPEWKKFILVPGSAQKFKACFFKKTLNVEYLLLPKWHILVVSVKEEI